jgi:hypothetical protein
LRDGCPPHDGQSAAYKLVAERIRGKNTQINPTRAIWFKGVLHNGSLTKTITPDLSGK